MTTLTQVDPTVKPTTLEIRGATYEARPIDPGFAGVAAVEVEKLVSGETYAVVLQADGHATCECPDYICRHADHGTNCKHIRGVMAAGLLVAPAAAPAPRPVASPVTPADVKRARYFGLTIPAAPVAPVVEPTPIVVAEVSPEPNPRDSWPAWTDADRWTTEAPDVAPVVRTTAPRPADAREAAEWLAIHWTAPVASGGGPALARDDESACPVPARPARFLPSVEDEAYASGYALQFDHGIAADPPAGWRLMRSSAFRLGQADGLLARHRREDEEHAAWVEERERDAFGDPADRVHPCERCGHC